MLESEHYCCGLCKTDFEVSRKEHKSHKSHEDLTKPQWQADSKTFRHWKSRTFSAAVATSRSEYFTVKRITKKLICCLSWSSREDWSADLCQKFPNYPSRPLITNTIEPEDIIIISETIPNSEQNLVCCAIWRTMILIEPFIRPHKQICYREQTSTAYIS